MNHHRIIRVNCNTFIITNLSGTEKLYIDLKLINKDIELPSTLSQLENYIPRIELLPNDGINELSTYQITITLNSNAIYGIVITQEHIYSPAILVEVGTEHIYGPAINQELDAEYIYSYIYSIYCEIIECRKNQLLRVLGELDNCKEECDCIALYDFNAFSILYEAFRSLQTSLNYSTETDFLLTSEIINQFTTMTEIVNQLMKYCIACETPCKDC